MNFFAPSKRKLFELLVLCVLAGIFYFFYPFLEGVVLFIFGFIWNWCASIEMDPMFENRRYRFSMLALVRNIQKFFLKPFHDSPEIIRSGVKVLPAGLFWLAVIVINESVMPWWAPFVGSLAFELMQLELKFIRGQKEGV